MACDPAPGASHLGYHYGNDISRFDDVAGGVRCWLYAGHGISCLPLRAVAP